MQRVILSLPTELLERIDGARGDVPRAAWLRRAAEYWLRADMPTPLMSVSSVQPMPDPYTTSKRIGQMLPKREVEPRFKKGN